MIGKNAQHLYLLGLITIALALLISIFPCGQDPLAEPRKIDGEFIAACTARPTPPVLPSFAQR